MERPYAFITRSLRALASWRGRPETTVMLPNTCPEAISPYTPPAIRSSRSVTAWARSCGTRYMREYEGSSSTTPSDR
jgi:hypothetical protein